MHLTNAILHKLETPGLSLNERTLLRCQLARQLERSSNYETAEEAMKEQWQLLKAFFKFTRHKKGIPSTKFKKKE